MQVYGKNLTAAMVQTVTFLFFKVKDKNSLLSTLRCVPTDAAMDGAQVGSSAAAAKPRPTAANSKKAKGKGKAKPKSKGKGKSAAHSDSDSDSTSDGWADTPKRKKPRHSGSDSGNTVRDRRNVRLNSHSVSLLSSFSNVAGVNWRWAATLVRTNRRRLEKACLLGDWRFRAANIHESSSAVLRWRVSIAQACVSANARTASERSYHRYAQRVADAIDIGSDLSGENENVITDERPRYR